MSLKHLGHHWRCRNIHACPPCRWYKSASLMMARGGKGWYSSLLQHIMTSYSMSSREGDGWYLQQQQNYAVQARTCPLATFDDLLMKQHAWEKNLGDLKRSPRFFSHVHCLAIIQLPNPPIGELNVQNTPGMITKNFHANNSRDTTTQIHPDWWPLMRLWNVGCSTSVCHLVL